MSVVAAIHAPRDPARAARAAVEAMLRAMAGPDGALVTFVDEREGIALGQLSSRAPAGAAPPDVPEWLESVAGVISADAVPLDETGRWLASVLGAFVSSGPFPGLDEVSSPFALAAWSATSRELRLARDTLGVRPLYHAHLAGEGVTIAASQLRGVLAYPAVGRFLDHEALSAYLTYGFVPAPLSLVAGVRKLRAGEVVRVGPDGRLVSGRHGTLPPPAPEERPLEEWAPLVWQALGDTVSRHTADQRRVGVYLSGGWDSAALAQAVADAPLDEVLSFTLTYERAGHERTDPAQAAALAERLGLRHHELVVRPEDAPPERLPALAVGLDEPVATFSRAYTGQLLARAAEREGIDVCLSGFSAEPVFGWYLWGDFLEARSGDGPPTLDETVDHVGSGDSIPTGLQPGLLVDPLHDPHALAVGLLRDHCAWSNADHPCDIVTRAMLRMRTPELMLPIFDRTAAPHGVEVRHPYHDARLLAFAGRIPLPLRGSESPAEERATLKAAVAGRLPVPTGEKEAVPRYPWLRGTIESEREGLLSREAFARFGVFRGSVLDDVAEGRIRRGRRVLWSVLLVHAWLDAMRIRA